MTDHAGAQQSGVAGGLSDPLQREFKHSWIVQLYETNQRKPDGETRQSGPERQQDPKRRLEDTNEETLPQYCCPM